jgi:ribonucleoside-diphosphate reductase alpha chain
MAILDADHPDVLPFVRSKALEEDRARALQASGLLSTDGPVREGASGFQNQNHSLRVTDAFLRAAEAGKPWRLVQRTDGKTAEVVDARALLRAAAVAAHACGDPGLQFADTIAAWNPVPRSGEIRASNPCSEFVFLDDTACNLASLNVLAFRAPDGSVDVDALRAAVRVLVVGMEAIVSNASYPTPAVARNSDRFRPLGLGLANVGSLLLASGRPYDSDAGRGLAAGVMALVGGEATATSARLAARRGPFAEWARNRAPALAVLARHRAAAEALPSGGAPAALRAAAVAAWREAESLAKRHGLRNAQVTCIAPTGTIAFLMDCDTTGVEPELSLVKEKKLVGGGRLRLVNRTVPEALARLGYDAPRAAAILAHVDREGSIEGAPGLDPAHLAVFDVAVPPRAGARALSADAHLSMMASLQPFVSGAISKTVNLPAEATVEDVERVFLDAWKRGLKAVAVYRDRSKVAQPLAPARGDGVRRASDASPAAPPQNGAPDGAGRCRECGAPMTTSGACFFCPNCGAATGCG